MEGNYCEARAKKKSTAKDALIKAAFIIGIIAGVLLGLFFGQSLFFILSLAAGIGAYFVFHMLKVEYEYVFCDGQLDFDKIMNGERRKHLARVDMEQAVTIAPKNSHSLDGYRHSGVKVIDYSSMDEHARIWGIVITAGEQSTVYYFEPDEQMINKMKLKSPRKVVEY
jgi:hypothetical protein